MNDPAGQFVFDFHFDRYRSEVTANPLLYDESGNFNSERWKYLQKDFKEKLDAKFPEMSINGRDTIAWKYIQDRRKQKKFLPGSIDTLDKARSGALLPFWDLPKKLGSRGEMLVNGYRDQVTKEAKAYFQQRHPEVLKYLRILSRYQQFYRLSHPGVDALLVEFYDYKAMTRAGMAIEAKRRKWAINNPEGTRS